MLNRKKLHMESLFIHRHRLQSLHFPASVKRGDVFSHKLQMESILGCNPSSSKLIVTLRNLRYVSTSFGTMNLRGWGTERVGEGRE